MNLENYKLTLSEFLIMLRNVCSYEDKLNYESISESIKKQVNEMFMHESLQVFEFCECCDSILNNLDNITKEEISFFMECLYDRIKQKLLDNVLPF